MVLGVTLAVAAATPEKTLAGSLSPLGIAIDDTAQGPAYDVGIAGVRLALVGGANRYMYGLSLGVLTNGKGRKGGDGDLGGLQIAGLVNDVDGAKFGAWQIAGFANIVRGSGSLIQLAGIFNQADGPMQGVQLAGLFNVAGGRFSGIQLSGVCNVGENDFSGLQIAAVNVVQATMSGIQIGAVNYAKTLHGIQIGAINVVADDMSGISLGAFNAKSSDLLPILRIQF